ncbi:MAG: sigma-70 family RNA polymerase sigma factor [Myxococcota bacterium]
MAQTANTARSSRSELSAECLGAAQRGEARAFRVLVRRYERPVFGVLGRMLRPAGLDHLVEDLAQETFVRAYRALPNFDPAKGARLSTWLLTIATRLAINALQRKQAVPLRGPEPFDGADQRAERRALGQALESAAAKLPANFRAVWVLHAYQELTHDEIATALGIEVGTVKSRLSRSRRILREALAEVWDG